MRLDDCGLDRGDYETIVVDNASTDGTGDAIAHRVNRLIRLRKNAGSTAKAYSAEFARGRYLLFLDDDSYPRPGSLARMIGRFEDDTELAAAGFTVHLPSGRLEGGALPGVFVGCGVGLRTDAYRAVGGLDRTFFMQAEEYDLCFRLAGAGWTVEVFDDLHVEHLKTEHARRSERTTFYDIRNNLRVIARYLPAPYARIYHEDCVERYSWLAEREGDAHHRAFRRGRRAGLARSAWERIAYRRRRLSPRMFERFFGWTWIQQRMAALAGDGVRRVAFADLGKNIYPFHAAARELGITVTAIADDRFAAADRSYRGTPILPVEAALDTNPDAVVVSNAAPVHAARTAALLALKTRIPVHCWFSAACETAARETDLFTRPPPSDELHAEPACVTHV
jgi:GT2 family glycosyltransferase